MKSQFAVPLTWFASSPAPYVKLPEPAVGTATGTMASTNTIYTNIVDLSLFDNAGLEVSWTGTPTGTISVMCSIEGVNFYALTFDPVLTQPEGSGGGYLVDLNQVPFRYIMIQYVNSSGSGHISVALSAKEI